MDDYQIHDLSEQQLKFGYWFLTHAEQLKKFLTGFVVFICVIVWGLAGWGLFKYLRDLPQDKAITAGIVKTTVNYEDFRKRHQPLDLQISAVEIIYTGKNKYDFLAILYNPNQKRGIVELKYRFKAESFITPTATVTILPEQKVYLLSLANESPRRLDQATVEIVGLRWQSLTEKTDLVSPLVTIEDVSFISQPTGSGLKLFFTAQNNLLKNLWEVNFQAVLTGAGRIVGVGELKVEGLLAGEKRAIEMNWFEPLPRVNDVEIIPVVNIYNPENYFETPAAVIEEQF